MYWTRLGRPFFGSLRKQWKLISTGLQLGSDDRHVPSDVGPHGEIFVTVLDVACWTVAEKEPRNKHSKLSKLSALFIVMGILVTIRDNEFEIQLLEIEVAKL